MRNPAHPCLAALAAFALATSTSAQSAVDLTVFGQVSALNPAPTTGPYAGALVGDDVEVRLRLALPGSSSNPSATGYVILPGSALVVGSRSDTFVIASSTSVGLWDDYLGLRDRIALFNEPLTGGGLARFELIDATRALLDTTDLVLLRGTYLPTAFTTLSVGAQVGGGFIEVTFERLEIGNAGLGLVYCAPGVPNSSGDAALMQVTGSPLVAANQLVLEARRLPANTFGFFLTSRTQANVANPGGSQGRLCLGGAIGRYQQQVQSSGTAGQISLAVAPNALPQPLGAAAAQVGETWNFQAWFRDANPTNTSNFTDAVALTFQ